MEVELTQENLARALNLVGRVAGTRATLPVLSNILIKTSNQQLGLAATNLEIGVTHLASAKITKPGSITVPARLMVEFINSLPPSNVSIGTDGQKLLIKAGQFQSTINGVASEEFPAIPEVKNGRGLQLPAGELKAALAQVIFAASGDETRPVLTACYLHAHNGALYLVATDSYRLAERRLMKLGKNDPQPELLIPARSLAELLRIIDDSQETVELAWDDAQAELRYGQTTLVSRLIDGKYPSYRDLIPKKGEIGFSIARDELLRITKVASLFARESAGGITLTIDEGQKEVRIHSVASQIGENTSAASAEVQGGGEVTLNSRYLIEALGAINASEVTFTASGKVNPCVLSAKDEPDYLHVIMPLRS
jgi:DNA polymerase-3 subunit beta